MKPMKTRFESDKFSDGPIMVRTRFFDGSNFWIHGLEEATWVPTMEEVRMLTEVLDVANEHNELKGVLRKQREMREGSD